MNRRHSIQKQISLSTLVGYTFIQMLLARTTRLEFISCYQAIPIVRQPCWFSLGTLSCTRATPRERDASIGTDCHRVIGGR